MELDNNQKAAKQPRWTTFAQWRADAERRDRHDEEKEREFWADTLEALKTYFHQQKEQLS